MGRDRYPGPNKQPRKLSGRIGFMPSDGFFLAARDLMYLVPLLVRIREVVEFPIGTERGGHKVKHAFNALWLDGQNDQGEWGPRTKPMSLNITEQNKLFNRFGEMLEWWTGQYITLDLAPTRDPSGGRLSGFKLVNGIIVEPLPEELDEDHMREQMRRAIRGECPYHPTASERAEQASEPPAETPTPEDTDPGEPPEGWQPGDGPTPTE